MNKSITDTVSNLSNNTTSKEDVKKLYQDLLNDISNNVENVDLEDKLASLSAEQIDMLMKEVQPYKTLGTASQEKQVIASICNLREEYYKKLMTTGLVGFLFQMKNEYSIDEEELVESINEEDYVEYIDVNKEFNINHDKIYHETVMSYFHKKFPNDAETVNRLDMEKKLTEDDLLEVSKLVNDEVDRIKTPIKNINKTKMYEDIQHKMEEQSVNERKVIERFLSKFFKYDPLNHVQEAQNKINDDPERSVRTTYSDDVEKAMYNNVPPNDTFRRFTSFYEVNYDKIRETTNNLYNVKPDLENAVIIYDVLDDKKDVDKFIQKYGTNSKFDILNFPLNQWTVVGAFKQNRERVNYYNKHNKIIESMLEQQETDNNLSADLLKNRVKTKKRVSERVFGKDSKEFNEYKKMNPSELETKYGLKMEDLDDGSIKISKTETIDQETGKVLNTDEDGTPDNALEIDVININAKTGTSSKNRIYTKSEEAMKK